jgi:pentatricopeptide repeat protein
MIAKHHKIDILRDVPTLFPYMVYNKVQLAIVTLESVISASAEVVALPRVCQVQIVHKLVDQLLDGEMASWNALVCGYGMHGHAHDAILLFDNNEE